ncbi:DNA-binding transcriptional LysR family regulator [Bradyrhizobium sp. RT11b]
MSYCLLYQKNNAMQPGIQAVVQWLREQAPTQF